MPTVSLSSVGTDNVTTASATVINNDFTTLQSAINALDNQNIAGAAAIAYSKLALAGSIVNADIAPAAAIAASKLAAYPADATKYLAGDGTWPVIPSLTTFKVGFGGFFNAGQAILANQTFETANAAMLYPFTIQAAGAVAKVWVKTGSTNSGNYDVGVLNLAGVRQVSKGSTAQSSLGTSAVSGIALVASLPAGQYFVVLACDNTSGNFNSAAVASTPELAGVLKVGSSFPIPASLTPGSTAPTNAPLVAITLT